MATLLVTSISRTSWSRMAESTRASPRIAPAKCRTLPAWTSTVCINMCVLEDLIYSPPPPAGSSIPGNCCATWQIGAHDPPKGRVCVCIMQCFERESESVTGQLVNNSNTPKQEWIWGMRVAAKDQFRVVSGWFVEKEIRWCLKKIRKDDMRSDGGDLRFGCLNKLCVLFRDKYGWCFWVFGVQLKLWTHQTTQTFQIIIKYPLHNKHSNINCNY